MSSLKTRKKLLIAESEINRLLLIQDFKAIRNEVSSVTQQARQLATLSGLVGALFAGLKGTAALGRKKQENTRSSWSWLSTALKAARIGMLVMAAIRPKKPAAKPSEAAHTETPA